jgi:hypothetical protein
MFPFLIQSLFRSFPLFCIIFCLSSFIFRSSFKGLPLILHSFFKYSFIFHKLYKSLPFPVYSLFRRLSLFYVISSSISFYVSIYSRIFLPFRCMVFSVEDLLDFTIKCWSQVSSQFKLHVQNGFLYSPLIRGNLFCF